MKHLLNSATNRNPINKDNYIFYFNKLLTSRGIKIQNDVLTKETVNANGLKTLLTKSGIIASFLRCIIILNPIQQ